MERHIFKGIPIYDEEAFAILETQFWENRSLILAGLPWLVSELIEWVGLRCALDLIYRHGGRKFYLRNERSDLSEKLGIDVPDQLYQRILQFSDSSGYVEIPSPWGVSERIRRALIWGDYKKGMTREEIRQTYGVSSRALSNIFKGKVMAGDGKRLIGSQ
ncbi:hypothetical protein [Aestuariispira insulae]|uniref:Mor transcription activator family protein n=1 Tax=Aestuariispira insulae TaxID=1461337 RepID=A0A3D9HSD1_9PROT|nr:hypothetical protein [Aestuariispira insulae]RED52370.1 hypothetical protein DFP90_102391 [Aestuariispira insulae]